jgi:PAS domain S-box-containing protein
MNDRLAEQPAGNPLLRDDASVVAFPGAVGGKQADRGAEAILAGISDGIVALDNEWRLVYANPAAQRIWGRDIGPLIGTSLHDALDISPDNPFRLAYEASKQSGEPIAFTGYSDVFAAWLDVRGYPHPDGYTILFRAAAAERSVPGRTLESEREREATRSINQRIFDTSLDLILVVDRRGDFLRVSPSSLAILGYAPEEMIGRSAQDFLHPDDLESTRENMRLARRGRFKRNFECRYLHKDGRSVPLAWTGIWSEPDGQYFFIGRDMSERVALEGQLRQAQKMEAVGQLTGGVAHDFNNILTVIIGMTELLSDALAGNAQLKPIVDAVDEAATRGAQLTQRMLAFARKQPLQARSFDLNESVSHAVTMLQRTLGEHIAVKPVLAEGLWPARADPSQVEDAILNLAVNARDAMPKGGQLVIETANAVLDEEYAAHNVEVTPGEYVAVSITDSGTGMPAALVERVFEPFFTTKEVGRGTGLGLSMVYGFVKQSRGHVKIYSELGHGTRITVYLPRAYATEQDSVPAALAVRADLAGHEAILVVEDSNAVRRVAVNILRSLGYQVCEAEDGPGALAILEQPGKIDLLFTDLIMPN